jgi:hypothetical protein
MRSVRRRTGEAADLDPAVDLLGDGIAIAVVAVVGLLVVLFVGLPLLVAIVDLAVVLLLATLGLIARVLFRRPWVVEAMSGEAAPQVLTWRVVGWRASAAKVYEVADQLEAGLSPAVE